MSGKLMTAKRNSSISKAMLRGVQWTAIAGSIVLLAACASTETNPTSNTSARSTMSAYPIANTNYFEQAKLDPYLVLNRLTWGANASSLQNMNRLGMDTYLRQQLQAHGTPLPTAVQAQIDQMTISQKPFEQMMLDLEAQRKAAAAVKGTDDSMNKAYQQELTRLA
ncbi:MAG: DUF1800 family protein, partial [Burkholderiaceae bacterium]